MHRAVWVSATVALVIAAGLGGFLAGDLIGYSSGHTAGYEVGYHQGYSEGITDELVPMGSFLTLPPGGSDTWPLNLGTGTFNVTLSYGYQAVLPHGPTEMSFSLELNFTMGPCPQFSTGWENGTVIVQGITALQCTFTDLSWWVILHANPLNSGPVTAITNTEWSISYRSVG